MLTHGTTATRTSADNTKRAIQQTKLLQSQLVMRPDPTLDYDNIRELGEREVTEMVNMAIEEVRQTNEDMPQVTIVGAKRTKGGAIIVQTNSPETGEWIRKPETLEQINKALTRAVLQPVTLNVLAKFVPVDTDIHSNSFIPMLITENHLQPGDISSVWWTKLPSRRRDAQQYAFLTIGFGNANAANKFLQGIRSGRASIEGQLYQTQRPTLEPHRCLKCQRLDSSHIAAKCPEKKDICGRCTLDHRTTACTSSRLRCANCKVDGHAATSRLCPTFQKKIATICERNQFANFPLFPTDDPTTWVTHETEDKWGPQEEYTPISRDQGTQRERRQREFIQREARRKDEDEMAYDWKTTTEPAYEPAHQPQNWKPSTEQLAEMEKEMEDANTIPMPTSQATVSDFPTQWTDPSTDRQVNINIRRTPNRPRAISSPHKTRTHA